MQMFEIANFEWAALDDAYRAAQVFRSCEPKPWLDTTHTHAHIRTHTHTHTHTHLHTHRHTFTHTHTHTHALYLSCCSSLAICRKDCDEEQSDNDNVCSVG